MLRGEEGKAEGREQSVAREVARGAVSGDSLGRASRGVDAGDRTSVRAQDAGVLIHDEPPLGVKEGRNHSDGRVGTTQRRLDRGAAEADLGEPLRLLHERFGIDGDGIGELAKGVGPHEGTTLHGLAEVREHKVLVVDALVKDEPPLGLLLVDQLRGILRVAGGLVAEAVT